MLPAAVVIGALSFKCLVVYFSAVNYASDSVSYTVTSGFVGAETSHIAVVIATTTIDSQKTIAAGR